jgi:hypothetical protein
VDHTIGLKNTAGGDAGDPALGIADHEMQGHWFCGDLLSLNMAMPQAAPTGGFRRLSFTAPIRFFQPAERKTVFTGTGTLRKQ